MCEWKVQKLEDLEEGTETIHEPMLILFSDSSLKVIRAKKVLHQG
jgi:hypothetical protein